MGLNEPPFLFQCVRQLAESLFVCVRHQIYFIFILNETEFPKTTNTHISSFLWSKTVCAFVPGVRAAVLWLQPCQRLPDPLSRGGDGIQEGRHPSNCQQRGSQLVAGELSPVHFFRASLVENHREIMRFEDVTQLICDLWQACHMVGGATGLIPSQFLEEKRKAFVPRDFDGSGMWVCAFLKWINTVNTLVGAKCPQVSCFLKRQS